MDRSGLWGSRTHLVLRPHGDILRHGGSSRLLSKSPSHFPSISGSGRSSCAVTAPTELAAIHPHAVHDHAETASERNLRPLLAAAFRHLHGPCLQPRPPRRSREYAVGGAGRCQQANGAGAASFSAARVYSRGSPCQVRGTAAASQPKQESRRPPAVDKQPAAARLLAVAAAGYLPTAAPSQLPPANHAATAPRCPMSLKSPSKRGFSSPPTSETAPIPTPANLRLRFEPVADCTRYDRLRGVGHGAP